jgi:hypothetical protein
MNKLKTLIAAAAATFLCSCAFAQPVINRISDISDARNLRSTVIANGQVPVWNAVSNRWFPGNLAAATNTAAGGAPGDLQVNVAGVLSGISPTTYQPLDADLTSLAALANKASNLVNIATIYNVNASGFITSFNITGGLVVGGIDPSSLVYVDVNNALQSLTPGAGLYYSTDSLYVTNHDGGLITTGTVAPARLGSGSSITTKYLRGDSTWQTISSAAQGLSTNWVNGAAVVGANLTNSATVTWTVSGTNVSASAAGSTGATLAGTNVWTGTNTFTGPTIFSNTVIIATSGDSTFSRIITTNINVDALTASRAVVLDAAKNLTNSATTATEIGYISGLASAVQTQLDNRQYTNAVLTRLVAVGAGSQGDLMYRDANGWTNLAKGSDGQYLKSGATAVAWAAAPAGTGSSNITDNAYVAEINNATVKTNLLIGSGNISYINNSNIAVNTSMHVAGLTSTNPIVSQAYMKSTQGYWETETTLTTGDEGVTNYYANFNRPSVMNGTLTNNVYFPYSTNAPSAGTAAYTTFSFLSTADRTLGFAASFRRLGTNIVTIPSNKWVTVAFAVHGTTVTNVGVGREE